MRLSLNIVIKLIKVTINYMKLVSISSFLVYYYTKIYKRMILAKKACLAFFCVIINRAEEVAEDLNLKY